LLWLVPTPIGNIADISLRSLQTLQNADIFLCEDTRITKQLLNILQERYSFNYKENAQFIPLHSHNEKEFIEKLSPSFFQMNVVYVSDAGMPGVSDPGALLVAYAQKHNIEYDVLPGANAVLTAYVASGFIATQFMFYGFLPHKKQERTAHLSNALQSGYVTILYEAPHRLRKLLEILQEIDPKRELFLAKELTKKYQKFY
jgi:16S rRNA (cytidine1402-2'-O)-methyltransferase